METQLFDKNTVPLCGRYLAPFSVHTIQPAHRSNRQGAKAHAIPVLSGGQPIWRRALSVLCLLIQLTVHSSTAYPGTRWNSRALLVIITLSSAKA